MTSTDAYGETIDSDDILVIFAFAIVAFADDILSIDAYGEYMVLDLIFPIEAFDDDKLLFNTKSSEAYGA